MAQIEKGIFRPRSISEKAGPLKINAQEQVLNHHKRLLEKIWDVNQKDE
jgi:hypothetical protein